MKAQTNGTLTAVQATLAPTRIFSDTADFDLKTRVVVYRGNVRVYDPQVNLTCAMLTAELPERGSHIESIVAETNVVIDMLDKNGQTNHATGDKLVYAYKVENAVTNEVARLTGNPRLDSPDSWLTCDLIVWDFIEKRLRVEGNVRSGSRNTQATNQPSINFQMPQF